MRDAFDKAMAGRSREREKDSDWRNCVDGAIAKKVGALGEPRADDPCAGLEDMSGIQPSRSGKNGRNLPGEFHDDMPELGHIQQAAYSRGRSADAVLIVVFARMSAFAPVSLVFDVGLGPSPITIFGALCGPPETGKTVSIRVGMDLLPGSQFQLRWNICR